MIGLQTIDKLADHTTIKEDSDSLVKTKIEKGLTRGAP